MLNIVVFISQRRQISVDFAVDGSIVCKLFKQDVSHIYQKQGTQKHFVYVSSC